MLKKIVHVLKKDLNVNVELLRSRDKPKEKNYIGGGGVSRSVVIDLYYIKSHGPLRHDRGPLDMATRVKIYNLELGYSKFRLLIERIKLGF